ncbi:unnamed protein product [Blepharisma stoltei]|uniref:PAS domain-containing protein n=1 Tax=Blepharisma stoltei TaxID=1481888 RepID=A0AAU9K9U8_9CILI|nr:unnamed protein product [Blepharisma stoltei]
MQGHFDETEFLKNQAEDEEMDENNAEGKDQILRIIKNYLFHLFFKLNTTKFSSGVYYYVIMITIETAQLLTYVMVDGDYSALGPYEDTSPWNLSQTQWLIDVCWVFRVDHYFHSNYISYVVLIAIWGSLFGGLISLCVIIALERKTYTLTLNFVVKVAKMLITLMTTVLFIPIVDTFAFGARCAFSTHSHCLDLYEGIPFMVGYIGATVVFVGVMMLCAGLYYDFCPICGNMMGKPHSRFKILKLGVIVTIIYCNYFIMISGKEILFLIVCLAISLIKCYVFIQYIPYYNMRMCNVRLAEWVAFLSAVFCLIIGQFFNSTDETNSSITMLFYFLTPCLVQISQLAMIRRSKTIAEKGIQHLTNPYQVEIKARMLVLKLEEARNKNVKSIYGENEEDENQEFQTVQAETLVEIENLYTEAFKKFPNAELLYLWSGLIQLHIFGNYILSILQCFKGILNANKLDSQYALYHFRRTSVSFYKAHIKDDAYDYELFEKAFQSAQKNDEAVTRSQFYFWAELESKAPKIQKLNKLAGETTKMIGVAKANYQKLLKLNSKNTQALRMYGWFLSSLNNYAELGQRYLNKAEMQEEAQQKNMNSNIMTSLTQPLSFFDSDNAILRISGDFETLGEIQKANASACQLLGYLSAELIGRNVSLIIPSPFSESHDDYIKKYHESGKHTIIDNHNLVVYFANKSNNIFEARLLLKVVPNDSNPPFLSAIIKPTNPSYETIMLSKDLVITGYTQHCNELFDLGNTKNSEQKIYNIINKFEEFKEEMMKEEGFEYTHDHEGKKNRMLLKLTELRLGDKSVSLLKIELVKSLETKREEKLIDTSGPVTAGKPMNELSKPVSAMVPNQVFFQERPNVPLNHNEINLEIDSTDSNSKSKIAASMQLSQSSEDSSEESSSQNSSEDSKEEEEKTSDNSSSGLKSGSRHSGSIKNKIDISGITEELNSLKNSKKSSVSSPSKTFGSDSEDKSQEEEEEEEEEEGDKTSEEIESDDASSFEKSGSSEIEVSHSHEEENGEENADQSVHSSSKSMNSSMGSLAQFNKSIKALIQYEFSHTKKYVMRFKITLIVTILILIMTSVITFEIIDTSITANEDLTHYVNLVGTLRMNTQNMAYYARMLSLMDSDTISNADRNLYFNWLESDDDDMHDINLKIYQNYGLLSSADKDVYIIRDIGTWLLEGTSIRELQCNLFDATSNMILQGYLLKKDYESSVVSLNNRRGFYLFRNGVGETLGYINSSASFYVDAALRDITSERLTAIMLIMTAVILLVFCALFAIVPAMKIIEKSRREVWEIFFEIPGYVCRVMKAKCSDRLNILNEQANLELEEMGAEAAEEQANLDSEKNKESTKKSEKSKEKEKKKKKILAEKKVLAYDPKQRKIMTFKMAGFFTVSLVYFYLIYYTGFEAVGQILNDMPIHVDWSARRQELTKAINFWVNEALFENITGIGYKYVVPSGQDVGDCLNEASRWIDELDYVENSLIFGNDEEGLTYNDMRSSEHDKILFDDACDVPLIRNLDDCSTAGDGMLMQGLHSALGAYTTLARNHLLNIQTLYDKKNYTLATVLQYFKSDDMQLLRDLDNHYLYDALTRTTDLYESDYKDQVQQMQVWQNLLISLYSVFSLLFFFLVYSPMINKIGHDTNNAWSMLALIPQEYQEDFKLLAAAIKERKDNFRWR